MLTVLKHSTLSFKNCHLIAKAANILKPAGDVMVAMSIFHMQSICVLLGFLIHWSDLYAYILVQYGCFGHFTGTFGHLVDGLGLWKYAISI